MSYLPVHFNMSEFSCRCCGVCFVADELLEALDQFRDQVRRPVVLLSACRCPKHNREVGGAAKSEHVTTRIHPCRAADIKVPETSLDGAKIPAMTLEAMYQAALAVPAFRSGGIGLYDGGFIHVDVRDTGVDGARWARVNGKYVGIDALRAKA